MSPSLTDTAGERIFTRLTLRRERLSGVVWCLGQPGGPRHHTTGSACGAEQCEMCLPAVSNFLVEENTSFTLFSADGAMVAPGATIQGE